MLLVVNDPHRLPQWLSLSTSSPLPLVANCKLVKRLQRIAQTPPRNMCYLGRLVAG